MTVAITVLAGALLAGRRVARRLGEDIVRLERCDGLRDFARAWTLTPAVSGTIAATT